MIGNGHAGFGRAASEKDPQGHLADVVPRRRCHPGAIERRWTRERVIEAMRDWRDALRQAAVLVRLVAHARAPARGRGARAAGPQASGRRRAWSPAYSARGLSPARRLRIGRGDSTMRAVAGVVVIWQRIDFAAETPGIRRKIRGSERR